MKILIAIVLATATLMAAPANGSDLDRALHGKENWTAWGGTVGLNWNKILLGDYGIRVAAPTGVLALDDPRPHRFFALSPSGGLGFHVENGALRSFTDGSLRAVGGPVLILPDNSRVDLRNFTLKVRAGSPMVLDLIGGDDTSWFYIDKVMFELDDDRSHLAVRAGDLRISDALAARIGHPEVAGYQVADLVLDTVVVVRGTNTMTGTCSPYPWPGVGVPGTEERYQADLFMYSISPQYLGCLGCTTTSKDGQVKFAPSSTLKNNVNDGSIQATIAGDSLGSSDALYTANIAWNTMFSADSPPYDNDQHPFLIWNLYRIDADGGIVQIGRSGVKHAWLTVNGSCLGSCYDSHALGRGCTDTYGTGNNDANYDLGPRSEVIPSDGLWGRCGSKWDPDCNGQGDHYDNGNGSWDDRMLVRESLMGPEEHPGSSYLFESWYLARDDIDIYNSMATVDVNVFKNGSNWVMNGTSDYGLGSAIDRWVDPANPGPDASNNELDVPEGHAKVAVKVTDLGDGEWRYDYAVMNFDFARAVTQNVQPGNTDFLQVLSNEGFDRVEIPLPAGATVSATSFSDGDIETANDWTVTVTSQAVQFNATTGHTLDWGSMYAFSVTVNASPDTASVDLHVAEAGSPASFAIDAIAPSTLVPSDIIFADGFESPNGGAD